jgi:hypothetical protein
MPYTGGIKQSQMTKKTFKYDVFAVVSELDETTGISNWIDVDELSSSFVVGGYEPIQQGNGTGIDGSEGAPRFCNCKRAKKLIWESNFSKGKLKSIRTNGYKKEEVVSTNIPSFVRTSLQNINICNWTLMPLGGSNISLRKEIDHRWGNKQKHSHDSVDDYQVVSKLFNDFKRQECKKCIETGMRYEHPEKNFVFGCQTYDDTVGCGGCPLAQPELYR